MNQKDLAAFIDESNRIEGISPPAKPGEMGVMDLFINLPMITLDDLMAVLSVIAPMHFLRDLPGRDVRVGDYYPPPGGPAIRSELVDLLHEINTDQLCPFEAHLKFERLHPFTDGNGRVGRAIWLWQMKGSAPLGFLHTFYYQTLKH